MVIKPPCIDNYRPEIDGLRGVAVLLVVFYHFGLLDEGFVGVDIFFVISGYLITKNIMSELELGVFSVIFFYERRLRRLLPALVFVVFFSSFFSILFLSPEELVKYADSAMSALFFFANYYFESQINYFDTESELKPLLHTWSLAVEEQFYILVALVALISSSIRQLAFWLSAFAIVSLVFLLFGASSASEKFYYTHFRLWEISVGSISAYIITKGMQMKLEVFYRELLVVLGLLLIFSSFLIIDIRDWPGFGTVIPVLGVFLFVLFSKNVRFSGYLCNKVLIYFGRRSYSIYLVHYPVISLGYYFYGFSYDFLEILSLVFLLMFISEFTYRFIENRFRIKWDNTSGLGNLTLFFKFYLFFTLFGVVFFIALIKVLDGYIFESEWGGNKEIASTAEREEILCKFDQLEECIEKNSNASVVLLGDSNAYHFAVGARDASPNNEIISLTLPACLPLGSFTSLDLPASDNQRCLKFNRDVDRLLTNEFSESKTVVISAAWLLYVYGDKLYEGVEGSRLANMGEVLLGDNNFKAFEPGERLGVLRKYILNLVVNLQSKFKYVVLMGPLPPQPYAIRNEASILFSGYDGVSVQDYFRYAEPLLDVFADVERLHHENVHVFYPHKQLCNTFEEGRCIGFYQGRHFYGDETHVSRVGQYIAYKELYVFLKGLSDSFD